jgi:hypothetical protein
MMFAKVTSAIAQSQERQAKHKVDACYDLYTVQRNKTVEVTDEWREEER